MKKLILGLLITIIVNIISLKAQPLRIATVTIGDKKEIKPNNKKSPLRKGAFITEKEDKREEERAHAKERKLYNKLHKEEVRKTKKLARRYEKKHELNAVRCKEKAGI